jgi:hypothetical protein
MKRHQIRETVKIQARAILRQILKMDQTRWLILLKNSDSKLIETLINFNLHSYKDLNQNLKSLIICTALLILKTN